MTDDAELRRRERAWRADPDPLALPNLIRDLRRGGREDAAWTLMVEDAEAQAVLSLEALARIDLAAAKGGPMMDRATYQRHERAIEFAETLRDLDGRLHTRWDRGQAVRISRGMHDARPPRGPDGRPTREGDVGSATFDVPLHAPPEDRPTGVVVWVGGGSEGREVDMPMLRAGACGTGVRLGVRLERALSVTGRDLRGWIVYVPEVCAARVVGPGWDELDRQAETARMRTAGELPEKGSKVEGSRIDPADGLREIIKGTAGWSGITRDGDRRVEIRRRGKPTVWVDLATVKVIPKTTRAGGTGRG